MILPEETRQITSEAGHTELPPQPSKSAIDRIVEDPVRALRMYKYIHMPKGFRAVGGLKEGNLKEKLPEHWPWPEGKRGFTMQSATIRAIKKSLKVEKLQGSQFNDREKELLENIIKNIRELDLLKRFFGISLPYKDSWEENRELIIAAISEYEINPNARIDNLSSANQAIPLEEKEYPVPGSGKTLDVNISKNKRGKKNKKPKEDTLVKEEKRYPDGSGEELNHEKISLDSASKGTFNSGMDRFTEPSSDFESIHEYEINPKAHIDSLSSVNQVTSLEEKDYPAPASDKTLDVNISRNIEPVEILSEEVETPSGKREIEVDHFLVIHALSLIASIVLDIRDAIKKAEDNTDKINNPFYQALLEMTQKWEVDFQDILVPEEGDIEIGTDYDEVEKSFKRMLENNPSSAEEALQLFRNHDGLISCVGQLFQRGSYTGKDQMDALDKLICTPGSEEKDDGLGFFQGQALKRFLEIFGHISPTGMNPVNDKKMKALSLARKINEENGSIEETTIDFLRALYPSSDIHFSIHKDIGSEEFRYVWSFKNDVMKNFSRRSDKLSPEMIEKMDLILKEKISLETNIKDSEEKCSTHLEKLENLNNTMAIEKKKLDDSKILLSKVTARMEEGKRNGISQGELEKLGGFIRQLEEKLTAGNASIDILNSAIQAEEADILMKEEKQNLDNLKEQLNHKKIALDRAVNKLFKFGMQGFIKQNFDRFDERSFGRLDEPAAGIKPSLALLLRNLGMFPSFPPVESDRPVNKKRNDRRPAIGS